MLRFELIVGVVSGFGCHVLAHYPHGRPDKQLRRDDETTSPKQVTDSGSGRLIRADIGYVLDMFRITPRLTRRLIRPISRPAAIYLAWTHRYTVALWWRSLVGEVKDQIGNGHLVLGRWKQLLTSLWRVSTDPRLANSPDLRSLAVDGSNVTVDAAESWHGRYLLDTRLGLTKLDPNPDRHSTTPLPLRDEVADFADSTATYAAPA